MRNYFLRRAQLLRCDGRLTGVEGAIDRFRILNGTGQAASLDLE